MRYSDRCGPSLCIISEACNRQNWHSMQHLEEYDCGSSACSKCTESEEEDKIDRDGESSCLKEGGIATESSMEHRGLSMMSKLSRLASEFQETVNAMWSKEYGRLHSNVRAEMLISHSKSGK